MSLESPLLLRKEKKGIEFIIIFIFSLSVLFLVSSFLTFTSEKETNTKEESTIDAFVKERLFDIDLDKFYTFNHSIRKNQFMGEILSLNEVSFALTLDLVKKTKDIFDVRHFRAGKDLLFVREGECDAPKYMYYDLGSRSYLKYTFCDDQEVMVEKKERPFTICESEASGVIQSSLSEALESSGLGYEIISKMEDALASSVDFYHVQKGDQFKLIYQEIEIAGKGSTYGEVLAAYYKNVQGEHYAIYFENDRYEGFYDLEGRPTKGAFLRSPVKFSRISSKFNRNRFHPIKKRRIPHLGTDYAASMGTPIMSVADGVVTKVSYTRNNGKYVKIRHDKTYETQYLHMSGFAPGIKSGTKVKQGQTIGYVGMTGLATGPHVCFRFWKNGVQINHLRENFPPADPLPSTDLPAFNKQSEFLIERLKSVALQTLTTEAEIETE